MILLFNARAHVSAKPILPMSLLAVAAPMDGALPYTIVDGNRLDDPVAVLSQKIRQDGIRVLAMTVMPGPQTASAFDVTLQIKRMFPDLLIVWGGYFPTMYPDAVMQCPAIDYAVQGYVAANIAEFFRSVIDGDPDHSLPGLVWRDENGTRKNRMDRLVNINQLPPFPYHSVDMESYMRPTFLGSRTISHHVSLGCPFKCGFCGVVNMVNGQTTAENPELAAEGVRRLVEDYGANAIEFYDNNFFLGEKRTREFCDLIAPYGVRWWAYGRADTLLKYSEATWKSMAQSGLHMVFVGAESGSDETLKLMNKGGKQSADGVLELVKTMDRHRIVPELSFIVGNPPDPAEDMRQTIDFIRRIKRLNPNVEIILYHYTPVPQANELLNSAEEAGFTFPTDLEDWTSDHWQKICKRRESDVPWISEEIRDELKNFRLVLDSAYPTTTDPNLTGLRRAVLRLAGGWRFATKFYAAPLELKILNRLIPYQRPETAGF